jgi:PD-(D/E)XK endonuclease
MAEISTPGLKGELGEVALMHKAISLGFALALPYGHIHRYDFIVESGTKLWRVQVKTTTVKARGMYAVTICRHANRERRPYTESEIDFVAVYIVPEDTWYILPVREVVGHPCLRFRPKDMRAGTSTNTTGKPGICCASRMAWSLDKTPCNHDIDLIGRPTSRKARDVGHTVLV